MIKYVFEILVQFIFSILEMRVFSPLNLILLSLFDMLKNMFNNSREMRLKSQIHLNKILLKKLHLRISKYIGLN